MAIINVYELQNIQSCHLLTRFPSDMLPSWNDSKCIHDCTLNILTKITFCHYNYTNFLILPMRCKTYNKATIFTLTKFLSDMLLLWNNSKCICHSSLDITTINRINPKDCCSFQGDKASTSDCHYNRWQFLIYMSCNTYQAAICWQYLQVTCHHHGMTQSAFMIVLWMYLVLISITFCNYN